MAMNRSGNESAAISSSAPPEMPRPVPARLTSHTMPYKKV
jgi:hypothetical protein